MTDGLSHTAEMEPPRTHEVATLEEAVAIYEQECKTRVESMQEEFHQIRYFKDDLATRIRGRELFRLRDRELYVRSNHYSTGFQGADEKTLNFINMSLHFATAETATAFVERLQAKTLENIEAYRRQVETRDMIFFLPERLIMLTEKMLQIKRALIETPGQTWAEADASWSSSSKVSEKLQELRELLN